MEQNTKEIKFIENSLIATYLSDYLEDISVAEPVKRIKEFTIYELDKKKAINEVLNNYLDDGDLKQSIIKDGDNWKVRIYKNQNHIPLVVNGKFYISFDENLIPFEDDKYYESLEEIEQKINKFYTESEMFYEIWYNYSIGEPDERGRRKGALDVISSRSNKHIDHPVRQKFINLIEENNIVIHKGWLVVNCREKWGEKDKVIWNQFSLSSGQIVSGDFRDIEEVEIHDTGIVRNGLFKTLDISDNIIVKNATGEYLKTGISLDKDDPEECPVVHNGNFKYGEIWIAKIYGGNFDNLVCNDKFVKLYNCNINNFILDKMPENFKKFKGTINNVIALNDKLELLKSNPKLVKIAKNIYISDVIKEDPGAQLNFKKVLSTIKPIDKKDLKKKFNPKLNF